MNLFAHGLVLAETAPAAGGGASTIAGLFPFLLIGLAFYFLIIRPQRKRQSEQQSMLRRIGEGDEIVTIGGFHGTIVSLAEETMEVELAPGLVVTMARNAISKALSEPAPLLLDDLDDDDFDDEFDDDYDDDDDFDGDDEFDDFDDAEDESGR